MKVQQNQQRGHDKPDGWRIGTKRPQRPLPPNVLTHPSVSNGEGSEEGFGSVGRGFRVLFDHLSDLRGDGIHLGRPPRPLSTPDSGGSADSARH